MVWVDISLSFTQNNRRHFFHSNRHRYDADPIPTVAEYSPLGGTAGLADFQGPIATPVSDDFRHFFTQIATEYSLRAGDWYAPYARSTRFYHLFVKQLPPTLDIPPSDDIPPFLPIFIENRKLNVLLVLEIVHDKPTDTHNGGDTLTFLSHLLRLPFEWPGKNGQFIWNFLTFCQTHCPFSHFHMSNFWNPARRVLGFIWFGAQVAS